MSEAGIGRAFGRERAARPLLWLAMPTLGVANQYLAERVAGVLRHVDFGPPWFAVAAGLPWTWTWIALELLTLAAWTVVLSQIKVSEAFPMTALGYVLVVGMGWTVFGETVTAAELVGGLAILAGVWLLNDGEAASP